ncbi:hypothetical protein LNQ03_23215 [Klebsiella pneumoniae subsp. pneumoniae]|nr:hypothetical protein [Klebsiella pneumoniae subsp. pneumoniae]
MRRQPFVASTLLGGDDHRGAAARQRGKFAAELSEEVLAEIEAVHQVYTYPAP